MNNWRISEALVSVRRLQGVIREMTEEEIVRAIALEEEALRRQSILQRLYRQARVIARTKHQAVIQTQVQKEK